MCKKSKYMLLFWDNSCAARHRGDRWRVPPVSRQGFYEHSSRSLCAFTREHRDGFMWSPLPPNSEDKLFLSRRTPEKKTIFWQCSAALMVSPELLWSKYFTTIGTTKTDNHSSKGMAEFPTLGSWKKLCMAMVLQGGNSA